MISRKHRFHGYNSLRHVYQKGKHLKSAALSVKYLHNDRRSSYRAAVVVSRKVSKSAVQRNRLRRQLYETIRPLTITEPVDIVITVFEEAAREHTPGALQRQLLELLSRAGIAEPGHKTDNHVKMVAKEH